MKDTLVNLLVFAVSFALVYTLFVGGNVLYTVLVPGGYGLVFDNPFAMALIPALISATLITMERLINSGKAFPLSFVVLGIAFWTLLVIFVPLSSGPLQLIPSNALSHSVGRIHEAGEGHILVTASLQKGPFGSQILGPLVVSQPAQPLALEQGAQHDPLNNRLITTGPQRLIFPLNGDSQESDYFIHTGFLQEIFVELKFIFNSFQLSYSQPQLFVLETGAFAFMWLGIFVLFSLKAFPLVQWVVVLAVSRLFLWVWVFVKSEGSQILSGVIPDAWILYFPAGFAALIGCSLFWLIVLLKPYKPLGAKNV